MKRAFMRILLVLTLAFSMGLSASASGEDALYSSGQDAASQQELSSQEQPDEGEPGQDAVTQPVDFSQVAYHIDESLTVVFAPTADQMRHIVEGAVDQTVLLDLSAFIGARGVSLELDMDWWFDCSGDRLTFMLTTGQAVEISDEMFGDGLALTEGVVALSLKTDGLSVSVSQKDGAAWYNAAAPLTISLPHSISDAQNPQRLMMTHSPAEGQPVRVIPRSWFEDGRVFAKVYTGGDFDVKYSRDVVYADVAGKWMEEAVNYTTARGVIAEKATGFAPDDTVTRVEFVRMFMRMLDIDITDYDVEGFNDDYAIPSWGVDSVNKALEMGIITGDGKGNFNPLEEITRQDMIVMIYRALDYFGLTPGEVSPGLPAFADLDQVSGYALEAVSTLAAIDLVHGYNGNINPSGIATRAEVVQMFHNILNWDAANC